MSKTHVIDGVTYVEVERKADVGDYVTYVYNFRRDDVVREVQDFDDEGVSFEDNPYVDSDGIEISGLCHGAYVVLEPLETEAIPSVTDLLANLARRVSSLEQQLSSTQTNVEKLAEELANVKHLTESNEQDIAMLDERTQPTEEPVTPDESIPQYWAEALIKFYGGNR
jgi:archaellum component FlaC